MKAYPQPAGTRAFLGVLALVSAVVAPQGVARANTQSCTHEMAGVENDGNREVRP